MARRKRDYKAEYQASVRRARAAGYKTPHEYKAARKALGTPRRASPLPKRVARTVIRGNRDDMSKAWSDRFSQQPASKFNPRWSEKRREQYYRIFVQGNQDERRQRWQLIRAGGRNRWRDDMHDYLVPDVYTEAEFDERYGIFNN